MSVKLAHQEINRFLSEEGPEVLVIKGKWGVGKTYTWNQYLNDVARKKKLSYKRYSYVSLFGVKDLESLKYSIFETMVAEVDIATGPTTTTISKGLTTGFGMFLKSPKVQSYIGSTERILFAGVRNQIICIDDLERLGEGLTVVDILGLISFLKEERKCKVVLLLNDEELKGDDQKQFKKQLEKISDVVIAFKPTPIEAAEIVFPKHNKGIQKLLYENSIKLDIVNIRVIKKIEKFALKFEKILKGKYSGLLTQAIHSATLFTWMIHQPDDAPPFEFVSDFSRLHGITDTKNTSEQDKAWQSKIREYGYSNTDDFDKIIYENIRLGYFNEDILIQEAEKHIKIVNKNDLDKAFQEAWNQYHDSFENNEKDVLDGIYNATKNNIKYITPNALDSAVTFLKEFNHKVQALELIKLFIKERDEEKTFNLDSISRMHDIKDSDLLEAFTKKAKSIKSKMDPGEVLKKISEERGWNPEDIQCLSKINPEDFYTMFKGARGTFKHQIIRSALDFANINPPSDEMQLISENAKIALQKIAGESKINARRISGYYGITPIKTTVKKKSIKKTK